MLLIKLLKQFLRSTNAIHEIKPVLMLNKPIYVGFTILELRKWLMYDFNFSFIKKHFDAELLFNDKDHLTYKTQGKNHKMEHAKSTKYHYLFIIIKDLF